MFPEQDEFLRSVKLVTRTLQQPDFQGPNTHISPEEPKVVYNEDIFVLKSEQTLISHIFPEGCTDHRFESTAIFGRHRFPQAADPVAVKPKALSSNLCVCSACDIMKSL